MIDTEDNYRDYVRPKYVDLMRALGLEKRFHAARGHTLHYVDDKGHPAHVIDFLGGYGAALFGHNDPEFVALMVDMLRSDVPFNAQMSIREPAGALAHALSEAVSAELGNREQYISTFSNSGAEAVEIALKHAEYRRQKRLEEHLDRLEHELSCLAAGPQAYVELETSQLDLPPGLLPTQQPYCTLLELIDAVRRHNREASHAAPVFVALRRGFHGKLLSSVQLTHGEQYRRPFARLGMQVAFLDPEHPNQLERLRDRHQHQWWHLSWRDGRVEFKPEAITAIAAVVMEPIQGEGGINEIAPEVQRALRRFCNETGAALVIDEIQSGFGRTGRLLASSRHGVQADCYCLSKALGGGLTKVAATMIRSTHYEVDFSHIHSSTFAEDDLSCRVALAALRRLQADGRALLSEIERKGAHLKESLVGLQQRYPDIIKDVRGQGLLLGLELQDLSNSASMVHASAQYNEALGYLLAGYLLQCEGVRVAPSGSNANVLRFEPPVTIGQQDVQVLVNALERACDLLRRGDALPLARAVLQTPAPTPGDAHPPYRAETRAPSEASDDVVKVAFINHLIDVDLLGEVDPSLAALPTDQKERFVNLMAPERRVAPIGPALIRSANGTTVAFTLYPLCMDSRTMAAHLERGDLEPVRREICDRIRDAREDGCRVAGLGMYTSIVTNNCQSIEVADVALTSGNALTIGMGLEAIEQACRERGIPISELSAAIVGATGNIASTYASLLASKVNRIVLIGSGKAGSRRRLERVAHKIYEDAAAVLAAGAASTDRLASRIAELPQAEAVIAAGDDIGRRLFELAGQHHGSRAPVLIADELSALRDTRIVVCAANAPEAFIGSEHLMQESIVCDIAVPLNVRTETIVQRPDVTYMLGGIVRTPLGDGLDPKVRAYLKSDQLYACMAETVLMGLSDTRRHGSFGDIDRAQVEEVRALAKAHGFALAEHKTQHSY